MRKILLKKDDMVMVITGREKNKRGKILHVYKEKGKILLEGLNRVKRHTRSIPQQKIQGGIIEKEVPIDISNVMYVCPNCNRPTRLGKISLADSTKVRICKKCNEVIEKK